MLARFLQGPIGRQIVTLAVLPIILVGVLGVMTEPPFPEDTDLTRAEIVAAQIALVADQIDRAGTPAQSEAVLAATRAAGLEVRWTGPDAEPGPAGSAFQDRLLYALSAIHGRSARAVAAPGPGPLIVVEVRTGFLAFAPAVVPVRGLNDDVVNILLSVMIIVLPVALLSIHAARLLTHPLTRLAAAAQAQQTADPGGEIFPETGPLEIRQLARRLNEMRAQIHSMLKERTAMLRAVSHDLRTPLTRLKLRVEQTVPERTAALLMRDITAINGMIDETLTYLRSETETEPPRKTDLPSLLRTICSDFSDVGFPVTYAGPDRLTFLCRSGALARAVANLVDNGTKFGGAVTIALAALPDGAVRIEVSDTGPGIPEDLRGSVLEPFVKGDPSRAPTTQGGFGLGLSIVREVVRRHGGTIDLAPVQPQGLAVVLLLPAMHPRIPQGPARPSTPDR